MYNSSFKTQPSPNPPPYTHEFNSSNTLTKRNKQNQFHASNQMQPSFNNTIHSFGQSEPIKTKSRISFTKPLQKPPQIVDTPCKTPISKQQRIPFLISQVKKLKSTLNQSISSIQEIQIQLNKMLAHQKDITYLNPQRKLPQTQSPYQIQSHPIFNDFQDGIQLLNSSPKWGPVNAQNQKNTTSQINQKDVFLKMMHNELSYYNRNLWKQKNLEEIDGGKIDSIRKSSVSFTYNISMKPEESRINPIRFFKHENRLETNEVPVKPYYTPMNQGSKYSFRKESESIDYTTHNARNYFEDQIKENKSQMRIGIRNIFLKP